jgi:hypothetical protein
MRHAVLWEVMDARPPADRPDWNEMVFALYEDRAAQNDTRWQELEEKRLPDTRPSLPLDLYTGVYRNPLMGDLKVVNEGAGLRLEAELMGLPVTHWHLDTFLVAHPPWQLREFLAFRIGPDGRVAGFTLFGETFEAVEETEGGRPAAGGADS